MTVVPMHLSQDKQLAKQLQATLDLDNFKALSAAYLISASSQEDLLSFIIAKGNLPDTKKQLAETPNLKEPSARAVLVLDGIAELTGKNHQVFAIQPDSNDGPSLLGVAIGDGEEGLVYDASHNTFQITNIQDWQKEATREFLTSLGPSALAFNQEQEASMEGPDVY